MPDLLVRNLAEDVMRALKERAAAHGRSVQQEATSILREAVAARPVEALAMARRLRARLAARGVQGADSGALVREDRDR